MPRGAVFGRPGCATLVSMILFFYGKGASEVRASGMKLLAL